MVSSPAAGQLVDVATTAANSTPVHSATSHGQRDAEYASLAKDVEAYGRELGIVKRVVRLVTPAVVHIEARHRAQYQGLLEDRGGRFGRHRSVRRQAIRAHESPRDSSFVAGKNRHPLGRRPHLASRKSSAHDSETDVAVMGVSGSNLPTARLGNSDALEIGDFVLAIGSPFGLSQSVTRGIVSAKGRHNLNLGDDDLKWQNFIQTDAAINPGNSGGPLVNLRGEVVGLNTAIASASGGNEGIGFSIPINIVSPYCPGPGRQAVDPTRLPGRRARRRFQ